MIVGHNIHDARFGDALGMIETQPVGGARTTIMTGDHEALMAKLLPGTDPVHTMVDMIASLRAYQSGQQAVQAIVFHFIRDVIRKLRGACSGTR